MPKKRRLTVGYRARIIPLDNKLKRGKISSWRRNYGGREVLLTERSNGSFSVLLIGESATEGPKTVEGEMAWIPEEDLEFVNDDLDTNIDFIDWYQENEEDL